MTFTYDGQKYTIALPYSVEVQGVNLSIVGANQNGPSLDIYIDNYKQRKSFDVSTQAFVSFNLKTTAPGYVYGFYNGTILFNSLTQTHLSATFSGVSFNSDDPMAAAVAVTGTIDVDIPQ